jgi:hypothetical protein
MRLRSRDFAVPMDAKGCEVMAVRSASVDDGARNPFRASTARRDQLRLAAEVIARSRCVSVLSRSHQPVGDCRGTPSPNAKLVLVAFRTRLTAMKNIRSRSAGGGDMDPYSSAAHDQCKIGSLLSNASTGAGHAIHVDAVAAHGADDDAAGRPAANAPERRPSTLSKRRRRLRGSIFSSKSATTRAV